MGNAVLFLLLICLSMAKGGAIISIYDYRRTQLKFVASKSLISQIVQAVQYIKRKYLYKENVMNNINKRKEKINRRNCTVNYTNKYKYAFRTIFFKLSWRALTELGPNRQSGLIKNGSTLKNVRTFF